MQTYNYPGKELWQEIIQRQAADHSSLEKSVKKILQKVKEKSDKAVKKFTKEFDGVSLKKLAVTEKEITQAASLLSPELKQAIEQAKKNIETFHLSQKKRPGESKQCRVFFAGEKQGVLKK